ncbi:VOC family protein [Xylophilus ampelinus]|uniref:Putative enzyme related to lactoylglutathione lyase n=1 Tax=Xylophilus ampelinus TaxID=54067 RepID=A0A318SL36_9BURK|nr:VOC family protein [Xylophilus ampelinus]MCS4509259.1 bleomycin resistance protein [Xylophilus ampelinus]PYE79715.1 putative enzyme related to lactoylglutathione lyase [Xylophilus ampelinus]
MKLRFDLLCRDMEAQMRFYQTLLGWQEAETGRSPIYRALEYEGVRFGFNAQPAYALPALEDRAAVRPLAAPVTAYATIMLPTPAAVNDVADRVGALGGRVIKMPYATCYGQWRAVLTDPEQHVFRISARTLPQGTAPAPPPPG